MNDLIDIKKIKKNIFFNFKGGLLLQDQKAPAINSPARKIVTPKKLYISYLPTKETYLCVEQGDSVLKGQALTVSTSLAIAAIHAPTSGKINKIVEDKTAKNKLAYIEIISDGWDSWRTKNLKTHPERLPSEKILSDLAKYGIVGMGGAGFPSSLKLEKGINSKLLIINAIECEPYVSCDNRLIRDKAKEIVAGIGILVKVLKPKHVVIALPKTKETAIAELAMAIGDFSYQLVTLDDKYPTGYEKYLIKAITSLDIPKDEYPYQHGITVQNIATVFAIKRALFDDEPLIQRLVTVAGDSIRNQTNYWVLNGTQIKDILDEAGFDSTNHSRLLMNGTMMGQEIKNYNFPVNKTTHSLLALSKEQDIKKKSKPCIKCSLCSDVCPVSLLPQKLLALSKENNLQKARTDYNLFWCIECRACDYICPSNIDLVTYFQIAKKNSKIQDKKKFKAKKLKKRFNNQKQRLEQEKQERKLKSKTLAKTDKLLEETAIKDALARIEIRKKQENIKNNIKTQAKNLDTKTILDEDNNSNSNDIYYKHNAKSSITPALIRARLKQVEKDTNEKSNCKKVNKK